MELNAAQHEAVHTLAGPLLVLAGAGTGKTRVVTYRIAKLIQRKIRPDRILAVTFTNKAAAEMQQRAGELIGKRLKLRPEISTFHSLCVRILRRHIDQLGYPKKFAICDRGDQESIARAALREIRCPSSTLRPGDLIYRISGWKTQAMHPAAAASSAQTDKDHLAAAGYRRYQNALRAAGSVDFDDLLLLSEELFRRFPKVRAAEAARFDHVLVDEYQDTNGTQYNIVQALAGVHRNLCVVGDDDQSIYGWRGAEVTHILSFKHDWPEAKVVRLQTNYRSTHEILAWANRLIAFNQIRHDKVLKATLSGEQPRIMQLDDEVEESVAVVSEIHRRMKEKKCRARDVAILFRTNEQPRQFETELRLADIPYVLLGSMSFFDRKEVRDLLAYLKVVENPSDEVSLLRIINTPPRGIGQATVKRLLDEAVGDGKPVWDVLPKSTDTAPGKFRSMIQRYREMSHSMLPNDLLSEIIRGIAYKDELARLYNDLDELQGRWAAVEELVNAASQYTTRASKPTLAGFLQETALNGPEDQDDKESLLDRDAVALMTLHSAKGLEFKEVYMVGMEEGFLPHRRSVEQAGASIDEERRLCYVGITRARRRLTLTLALSRRKWGKARPTDPSRFLYEVTGQADNPRYLAAQGKKKRTAKASAKKSKKPRRS